MPAFHFLTRDSLGTTQRGTLAAASVEALTAQLRGRGLLVLNVEPAERDDDTASWNPVTWLPATNFDAEIGFQQLATMLRSGLSLLAALRIVAEQARRPRAAGIWRNVALRIEEGSTFSQSLAAHPRVFSAHVVQLIRVGEHAGTLDSALVRSAEHLERARSIRLLVLNALAYPLLVLILVTGVAAFMVISVIPKVQKFLGGSSRKLPEITQMLVNLSDLVTAWLPWITTGLISGSVALFACYRWAPGRRFIDSALLRIPVIGHILRLSGTAVFARALGSLLESGVTLLDSLVTLEALLRNRAQADRVSAARDGVLRGETLAASFTAPRAFMPMLGRMIAVGESAGTLGSILDEVATFHENQLVQAIRRMSAVMEPLLILLVGGVVGFVYIAFFVSVFSLAGGLR